MKTILYLGLLTVTAFAQTPANKPASTDPFQPFAFLLGKWDGRGIAGQPGSGSGAFSFDAELDHHILVRHNYAQHDNGAEGGTRHDDLLIVYVEAGGTPRAIYFDSEGHVIHYRVSLPKADSVVFESEEWQSGPRYRLSYVLKGVVLDGKFEIANSSGAPYKTYLSWTAAKK